MDKKKVTFALAFCNRGFMPGELIYAAREELIQAVQNAGYDYIAMDPEATKFGGIETREEGALYAEWLNNHRGQFDGVKRSNRCITGCRSSHSDAGVSGRIGQNGLCA